MSYDQKRIDDAVLALLETYSFDQGRSWKGFDFDVMDRLFEQGFITDPKNKNKSIWLTEEGIEQGRKAARRLFEAPSRADG